MVPLVEITEYPVVDDIKRQASWSPPALPAKPGVKLVSQKPSSPCFVEAVHEVKRTELAVSALMKCQRTLIQNYVTLGVRGVFPMSMGDTNEPVLVHNDVHGHPMQDPTGALMAALLVVRRNRPGGDCWMDPPHEMNLLPSARRSLAAMLCVCHKMAVAQSFLNYEMFIQYVMQLFLLPQEFPKWRADWEKEFRLFDEAEMLVVTQEPLLSIVTNNPLSEAEVAIGELVVNGAISKHQGHVLRGCCFFLLGSCLMNPAQDVLEQLAENFSMSIIGHGVVSLLLTLYYLANSDEGRQILYRAPYDRSVDQVAQVILVNATSAHANQLRVGPYRAEMHTSETPQIVQKMLSPVILAHAKGVWRESAPTPCIM